MVPVTATLPAGKGFTTKITVYYFTRETFYNAKFECVINDDKFNRYYIVLLFLGSVVEINQNDMK